MRGPKVFKGYWRDPEATARPSPGGWFHTGDIGVRDDDGYLFIVDRLKDMIVSGGENIAGSEVERVLYEHEAVLEAAVVGRPDERWGEVPVAFVVVRPGATAHRGRARRALPGQLARFKVPKGVTFLDALPRNPSGKVLKRQLRAPPTAGSSPRPHGTWPALRSAQTVDEASSREPGSMPLLVRRLKTQAPGNAAQPDAPVCGEPRQSPSRASVTAPHPREEDVPSLTWIADRLGSKRPFRPLVDRGNRPERPTHRARGARP